MDITNITNIIVSIIIPILIVIIPLIIGKKFREVAYKLFLEAEKYRDIGKEKFDYVIDKFYYKYPVLKIIIPKVFLESYMQYLFDTVKDLLDDGKIGK